MLWFFISALIPARWLEALLTYLLLKTPSIRVWVGDSLNQEITDLEQHQHCINILKLILLRCDLIKIQLNWNPLSVTSLILAAIEDEYDGPALDENGKMSLKFAEELMEFYKQEKRLHKKYAYQVTRHTNSKILISYPSYC